MASASRTYLAVVAAAALAWLPGRPVLAQEAGASAQASTTTAPQAPTAAPSVSPPEAPQPALVQENQPGMCTDGQDNDGDGYVDCNDLGCGALDVCPKPAPFPESLPATRPDAARADASWDTSTAPVVPMRADSESAPDGSRAVRPARHRGRPNRALRFAAHGLLWGGTAITSLFLFLVLLNRGDQCGNGGDPDNAEFCISWGAIGGSVVMAAGITLGIVYLYQESHSRDVTIGLDRGRGARLALAPLVARNTGGLGAVLDF